MVRRRARRTTAFRLRRIRPRRRRRQPRRHKRSRSERCCALKLTSFRNAGEQNTCAGGGHSGEVRMDTFGPEARASLENTSRKAIKRVRRRHQRALGRPARGAVRREIPGQGAAPSGRGPSGDAQNFSADPLDSVANAIARSRLTRYQWPWPRSGRIQPDRYSTGAPDSALKLSPATDPSRTGGRACAPASPVYPRNGRVSRRHLVEALLRNRTPASFDSASRLHRESWRKVLRRVTFDQANISK